MNYLTDTFPDAVMIDGKEFSINTDFRTCLKAILAFEDEELAEVEKQIIMLSLLYPIIPDNVNEAQIMAIKFLDGGEEETDPENNKVSGSERLYSFSKDSKFIFAGIFQTHGIDLEKVESLHWWKFLTLFMDISDKCFFSYLVYIRGQLHKNKLTKEEREWYVKNKNIVDLPITYLEDEKEIVDSFF